MLLGNFVLAAASSFSCCRMKNIDGSEGMDLSKKKHSSRPLVFLHKLIL